MITLNEKTTPNLIMWAKRLEIFCIWKLTTIVLYEPQVWELGPHVTLDTVKTSSKWGDLGRQHGGEIRLLLAQRGRRMAAVHGDGRSLDRGNHKGKPKNAHEKRIS